MRYVAVSAFLAMSVSLCTSGWARLVPVASDSVNNPAYAPQPNSNWANTNGGFGYNKWTILGNTAGGGRSMPLLGTNTFGFGLVSDNGPSAVSRALASPIVGQGQFILSNRFNLTGSSTNLISLRTGNNTNLFASGELLAIGLIGTNQFSYRDLSGTHLLPIFNASTNIFAFQIDFDTIANAYNGFVLSNGIGVAEFGGAFEFNGEQPPVGSFAVLAQSSGVDQQLIFDAPQFSAVPEPAAVSIGALGVAALIFWRRRDKHEPAH